MLNNGQNVIKGRWKLVKKIGQGAFGEIYQAKSVVSAEDVAIKLERVDSKKQVLKLEVAVLKRLQDCSYVCRFITCGRYNDFNYMVMELLGDNLSELRRRHLDGRFSLTTTLKLGMQMLKGIEAVHELGYLHRDIKPSNFAVGLNDKRNVVFLIDFGLARRYLLPNNEVRPARDATGFRGTARYASINSHQAKDLGRRDDLWSLFYVLVEFAKGSLPWRKLKDKDQIGEMKIQYNNASLISDLPPEFMAFMMHLKELGYEEKPNYNYLQTLLKDLYTNSGGNDRTLFDWEVEDQQQQQQQSLLSQQQQQQQSPPVEYVKPNQPSKSTSQHRPRSSRPGSSSNIKFPVKNVDIDLKNQAIIDENHLRKDINNNNNNNKPAEIRSASVRLLSPISLKSSVSDNSTKLISTLGRHTLSRSSILGFSETGVSPVLPTVTTKQSYVSSNVDATTSALRFHRRCASLPVDLVEFSKTSPVGELQANGGDEGGPQDANQQGGVLSDGNGTQGGPSGLPTNPEKKLTDSSNTESETDHSSIHGSNVLSSPENTRFRGKSENGSILEGTTDGAPAVKDAFEVTDGKGGKRKGRRHNSAPPGIPSKPRRKDKTPKCCGAGKGCTIQ